jgi:prevent-host-death family protein
MPVGSAAKTPLPWAPKSVVILSSCGYNNHMAKRRKLVGSRELKTRLGTYLEQVRRGDTIIVTDRGEPIAELRPITAATDPLDAALDRLASEGLITRASRKGPPTGFRPVRLPAGSSLTDAILEDRKDRF